MRNYTRQKRIGYVYDVQFNQNICREKDKRWTKKSYVIQTHTNKISCMDTLMAPVY